MSVGQTSNSHNAQAVASLFNVAVNFAMTPGWMEVSTEPCAGLNLIPRTALGIGTVASTLRRAPFICGAVAQPLLRSTANTMWPQGGVWRVPEDLHVLEVQGPGSGVEIARQCELSRCRSWQCTNSLLQPGIV